MTFCPECGKENAREARFCNYCGSSMNMDYPSIRTKSEYAPMLKLLVTVIILVIAFYVVFAMPISCTATFSFGITANGHTTIWQTLTGNPCSYP